jgi:predicted restriction endonuclease
MLLAVMDSVSKGFITEGFVPQDERMVRCFMRIWDKYVGQSLVFRPIFATPFYHLSNEPFWTLIKTDGYVEQREYSLSALRRCFSGAKIEDDLWGYMLDPNTRDQLVKILLGSIMSDQE